MKMKTIALMALAALTLSGVASGKDLDKSSIDYCIEIEKLAQTVTETKERGVSRSAGYAAVSTTDLATTEEGERQIGYLVIDMVYNGHTPDSLFDLCIKAKRAIPTTAKKGSK